jgi:hypothetical protein
MEKGILLISLDYEKMWGVHDCQTKFSYGKNILGVDDAIDSMINSFKRFNVNVTFAVVGFMFHKNKNEILTNNPTLLPSYDNFLLSPYDIINTEVGQNENEDPYFYGLSSIKKILSLNNHEICTHTYSHYYCLEKGQTINQFESDLLKAIEIAKNYGLVYKSIIFPRNQCNSEYIEICKKHGILSFRGNEKSLIYRHENLFCKIIRLIDSYINLTGYNCYSIDHIQQKIPFNFPSSRFLRPFSNNFSFLEKLKYQRIKKAMTFAAKNNLVYHLWWHPHNFGINLEQNIKMLNEILSHYKFLNYKYGFESKTMSELSLELINKKK